MRDALRVLYVEDNPQNRKLLARIGERAGWEVEDVEDGEAALARLDAGPAPDLILMDLALPVLDGYETTRRIRRDPRLAWLPVIAVTAHAMSHDEDRAREAGCDGYLTKPLDVRRFPDQVRGELARLRGRELARRGEAIRAALEEAAGDPEGGSELLGRAAAAARDLARRLREPIP